MKKELFLMLLACPLLFSACGRKEKAVEARPVVIFDTDMGNDVDDALALRMLLRYDQEGKIDLKGVSISKNNPHAIEFVDGFCRFSGYGDIPLAFAYEGVTPDDNAYLLPTLAAEYGGKALLDVRRSIDSGLPEGYVGLRKWLSASEDGSVLLIATGPLTNIANLLVSGPDEYSGLDGVSLVARKVKSLHLMNGYFGVEQAEWNVLMDIPASQVVYEKCPVPLVTSGWEVGAAVLYPHESILRDFGDPGSDPLSVSYQAYMPMPYDRECWDLTSVLDAIEPDSGIFIRFAPGRICVDSLGVTRFTPDPQGLQSYLKVVNPDAAVSALVRRVSGCEYSGSGLVLFSPDARNRLEINCDSESLTYTLYRDGKECFRTRPLGMTVGRSRWGSGDVPRQTVRSHVRDTVRYTVPRKCLEIKDQYNSLTLDFGLYAMEFRAYDSGVAYRFIGKGEGEEPVNERGGYLFPEDYASYVQLTDNQQNWFEENYTEAPLSGLDRKKYGIEPVLVMAGDTRVLFADANTSRYAGSYLQANGEGFDLVFPLFPSREDVVEGGNKRYATSRHDYIVKTTVNRTFPWRAAGIFASDADLFQDDLIYLLSDKTEEDYSWVKPGKALWDWWNDRNVTGVDFVSGINTATYKYLVDYAAAHHFEYVLIDEGWSAREDILSLNPDTDIPAVCDYAREKGVGICLWAKWVDLDRQMEEAFRMMSGWGVSGVKIDFMDRNDAAMVDFYERVAQTAARYHMLVDFHGAYPNEGMRARYPHLLTREGVVGLEYNKMRAGMDTPHHELLIPFIRQWVGPMDFTPGSMLNSQPDYHRIIHQEPMSMGTRCHQLAMYVVYESPLQMVSDSPDKYDANPGSLAFIEQVPTVWDETVVLAAELGRRIVVARRHGEKWYMGAMLSGDGEKLDVPLSFLPAGSWKITSWCDGVNASRNAKDYRLSEARVDNATVLPVVLENNGGWTAILERL